MILFYSCAYATATPLAVEIVFPATYSTYSTVSAMELFFRFFMIEEHAYLAVVVSKGDFTVDTCV